MSGRQLKIAIGQMNPIVGDVAGNLDRARAARRKAAADGADLLVLTELFISGYPPEDLVLRPAFIDACRKAVETLASETGDGGPAVLIGAPWAEQGMLFNSALLLDGGKIIAVRHKIELPNYGVFDEKRVFDAGPPATPVRFRDWSIGIPICEDLWKPSICAELGAAGAELLISIHGSPYWRGKAERRREVASAAAGAAGCPVIYANMIGGQDELVFDGGSFGVDRGGEPAFQFNWFEEAIESVSLELSGDNAPILSGGPAAAKIDELEADWRACVLGLRDYAGKNGFQRIVIGLSGGIDSAVTAAIAVDALGPDKVRCVMLPSRYTSDASLADAAACAEALGASYQTLPIGEPLAGFEEVLSPVFEGREPDVTEENLQARIRGVLLMAISNKFGELLVTTGNKSEVSVGYATLYGDMNGGFNPIKDLYKTDVYRLAAWRNAHHPKGLLGPGGEVIPPAIISKAPSAELRPNQTDQDSLPPYDVLDAILNGLIEEERGVSEIVASGHDRETVRRIARLVAIAEYKRRQAAPGVNLSQRNFGRGRRYPITNRFIED